MSYERDCVDWPHRQLPILSSSLRSPKHLDCSTMIIAMAGELPHGVISGLSPIPGVAVTRSQTDEYLALGVWHQATHRREGTRWVPAAGRWPWPSLKQGGRERTCEVSESIFFIIMLLLLSLYEVLSEQRCEFEIHGSRSARVWYQFV